MKLSKRTTSVINTRGICLDPQHWGINNNEKAMIYGLISHSGLATVVLNYTNEFWPLGIMLFGLVALSGGMIALTAIWHHRSQTGKPEVATALPPDSYDTAA
jgi:hypothetical protein